LRRGAWRIAALDLCDLGWGKELPGYEFPSPFSSKSLSLSLSLSIRLRMKNSRLSKRSIYFIPFFFFF
jgi:hypothetical protein